MDYGDGHPHKVSKFFKNIELNFLKIALYY